MLNIEKYKDELKKCKRVALDCQMYQLRQECKKAESGFCFSNTCSACREDNIEWLLSETQILDDAEKRYLKGVIRPFRNEVKSIWKLSYVSEQIVIQMQSGIEIKLPCFKKGTMYQGMEESKKYTIEELGL